VTAVEPLVRQYGEGVAAVPLDVTDAGSVARAADRCPNTDILVNNAGVNRNMWLLGPTGMEDARAEIEVNYLGTLAMCRAFAPVLTRRQGMIVTIVSIIGLVNLPINGTYCASKAALHSLVQGVRAELAPRGVRVVGVYPGPVDTRLTAGLDIPKATPAEVAAAVVAGIVADKEEIFPDPMSEQVHDRLCADAKAVERQYATMIPK
jgi:NAD(P)-dependent dehydrogenase (short-subunit alcohol dehydrogenase family)